MKKKKIIGLFIALAFVFGLSSCNNGSINTISDDKFDEKAAKEKLYQLAYEEYFNSFDDLDYEGFKETALFFSGWLGLKVFILFFIC